MAAVICPVLPDTLGYIAEMAMGEIGLTLVQLGGGRTRPDDDVPPGVTVTFRVVPFQHG